MSKKRKKRRSWSVRLIVVMRAFTVGLAYFLIADLPGLTSSFVAIFVALLAFDLIVAMNKFSFKFKHWRELFVMLIPRISATAIMLARGLLLGGIFGWLTHAGLPVLVGGVLTIGLAYQVSERTRGNISSYVGMLAGLTLFDQIVRIDHISPTLISDIGGTALRLFYSTFTALFVGWLCGALIGAMTRLVLRRGYRTTVSSAYELPLSLQPFKDVIHTNENMSLLKIKVGDHSSLAYKELKNSGLRQNYQTSVLSIYRKDKDVVAPVGDDIIYPRDTLVLVIPTQFVGDVLALVEDGDVDQQ